MPAVVKRLPFPNLPCLQMIRTAVIGVGYLGRFHAQKYAALPHSELVAVTDVDPEAAARVAEELGTRALSDYRELFGQVDAVSIVVPTQLHYEVAKECLENGLHVLVEKPITATVAQAEELVQLARQHQRVLQVGHLERFNAAILALDDVLLDPLFIESHRLASFNPRGADVNVVLDLMIHDIEIIQNLVRSPVLEIHADGVSVLTNETDIANARIKFENGCVANVTASRVSLKPQRKMRVFQHDMYIGIDFQDKTLSIHRKGEKEMFPGIPEITSEETAFESSDAIMAEIEAFLDSITEGKPAVVSGEDGCQALKTATRITEMVTRSH